MQKDFIDRIAAFFFTPPVARHSAYLVRRQCVRSTIGVRAENAVSLSRGYLPRRKNRKSNPRRDALHRFSPRLVIDDFTATSAPTLQILNPASAIFVISIARQMDLLHTRSSNISSFKALSSYSLVHDIYHFCVLITAVSVSDTGARPCCPTT